jgi:Fibronectin type III domain
VLSGGGNRLELDAEATFVDPNVIQMKSGKGGSAAGAAPATVKVARPKAAPAPVAVVPSGDQPPLEVKPQAPVGPTLDSKDNAVTAMGKMNAQAAAALSYLSVFGAPIPEAELSKKYGKLEGIQMTKQGKDYLELAWERPNPDSPPQSYRVEASQQVYEPVTKMFFRQWVPMPEVKTVVATQGWEGVRLTGLRHSSQYEVRILAVDELGKVSPPSDIYVLSTLPPWRPPLWWWYAGALALLGGLLWQARRLYLKRMGLSFA